MVVCWWSAITDHAARQNVCHPQIENLGQSIRCFESPRAGGGGGGRGVTKKQMQIMLSSDKVAKCCTKSHKYLLADCDWSSFSSDTLWELTANHHTAKNEKGRIGWGWGWVNDESYYFVALSSPVYDLYNLKSALVIFIIFSSALLASPTRSGFLHTEGR